MTDELKRTPRNAAEASLLAGALRALARNRAALLAVVLLLIISLASVFAGALTPHDPLAIDLAQALQPPSATSFARRSPRSSR